MRILAAFSILTIAVVGCQATEPGSQDRTSTAGVYVLRTINDTVPPFIVLRAPTYVAELLSDTLSLAADGGYRGIQHYKITNTDFTIKQLVDTVQGTWIILGATVSFKSAAGDLSTATSTVSSTKLTVAGGGLTSVYTK